MRALSAGGLTVIASPNPSMALLAELQLTEPLYLNSSSLNLDIFGTIYTGLHGLGQVERVEGRPGEMPRLKLTMSGVPSDKLALAITEETYNRDAVLSLALFSAAGTLTDVIVLFEGSCDVLAFADGPGGSTLQLSVESGATTLLRPSNVLYTDAAQRRINPNDRFLEYVTPSVEKRLVFPAASYFRR